jgi:hypothetical protein
MQRLAEFYTSVSAPKRCTWVVCLQAFGNAVM